MPDLRQAWPRASHPRPIVLVGAGAIARTAHLPAYARLHYPVAGLYDIDAGHARATADEFALTTFASLADAIRTPNAVFDLAVPGDQVLSILEQLPERSVVLIQKPMGPDLATARRILDACTRRRFIAAVNFQLRFSPGVLALKDLVTRGTLGELVDIDVRLVVEQPWHNWTFLRGAPRLEVVYHSIHYIDAIRWLAGEPRGVYCRGVAHPATPQLRDTRTSMILDYGDHLRCSLVMNHTHRHGPRQRMSQIMVEGTDGAARLTMGVNLSYPSGPPDTMEIARGEAWTDVRLRGSWFTEAFEGPMSNLQRFAAGEDSELVGSVQDAIKTMAVVEACYESSAVGATPIPSCE